MPRKIRPIHTERVFHVFNRGNYRYPIFETKGAREAFLEELAETVSRFGWVLYAYALMSNHCHLCLRTPRGNLSEGMQRLLTAFAVKFNRFRDESGHVFQGRFKCTVASEGVSARRIIDYIHLNPTRAGLGEIGSEASLGLTSLREYLNPGARGLVATEEGLARFLGFADTLEGRLGYVEALGEVLGSDPTGEVFEGDVKSGKREAAKRARQAAGAIKGEVRLGRETAQRLEMQRWEEAITHLLGKHRIGNAELSSLPKAFGAKLEIARELSLKHGASYSSLAERLKAGTPDALRMRLKEQRQKGSGPTSV
jgi:REP element-mobilizing transposase RayT